MDRILNMVIRQVLRRFVNLGVSKGMGLMSSKGGGARAVPGDEGGLDTRASAKRAKQAMRVARRLGR